MSLLSFHTYVSPHSAATFWDFFLCLCHHMKPLSIFTGFYLVRKFSDVLFYYVVLKLSFVFLKKSFPVSSCFIQLLLALVFSPTVESTTTQLW